MKKAKRTAIHGRRKVMNVTVKKTGRAFTAKANCMEGTPYRIDHKTVIILKHTLSEAEKKAVIGRYRWHMSRFASAAKK